MGFDNWLVMHLLMINFISFPAAIIYDFFYFYFFGRGSPKISLGIITQSEPSSLWTKSDQLLDAFSPP
jgi:hypothetical protein